MEKTKAEERPSTAVIPNLKTNFHLGDPVLRNPLFFTPQAGSIAACSL
jgi:hypothetical protein